MSYFPTGIFGYNVETEEKEIKPMKVASNLELIAKETNELGDGIKQLEARQVQEAATTEQESSSFRKLFLGI